MVSRMQENRGGSGDTVFDVALLASFDEKLFSSAQIISIVSA
jgi:hypothetical protein